MNRNSGAIPDESLLEYVVYLANKQLGRSFDEFLSEVKRSDVAFAVWKDLKMKNGVDCIVVKGQQRLREIVGDQAARSLRISAMPCGSYDEGEALRLIVGDGAMLN